jgi:hypothetical protein
MDENNQDTQWLQNIPDRIGDYLAGFADGEGSFVVSLVKRSDYVLGWKPVMIFNVSQRDKTVLVLFKRYLGCGRFQYRKDGVWYYVVSNPRAITERVIPFFKRFSFFSATKKKNFSIFQKVASIMLTGGHYTQEGLNDIIELREQLNVGKGRKRKYEKNHYQQWLAENPQRLYARVKYRPKHLGRNI